MLRAASPSIIVWRPIDQLVSSIRSGSPHFRICYITDSEAPLALTYAVDSSLLILMDEQQRAAAAAAESL